VILASVKHEVSVNNTTLRIYHANKGEGIPKHQHAWSHLTMCHSGSCLVRKEGRELLITKDTQPVNLVADEWHEIEAMEDNTVFVNVFEEGKY
jgi:quercetin dioxygenase-like cupin family protein